MPILHGTCWLGLAVTAQLLKMGQVPMAPLVRTLGGVFGKDQQVQAGVATLGTVNHVGDAVAVGNDLIVAFAHGHPVVDHLNSAHHQGVGVGDIHQSVVVAHVMHVMRKHVQPMHPHCCAR